MALVPVAQSDAMAQISDVKLIQGGTGAAIAHAGSPATPSFAGRARSMAFPIPR